MRLVMLVLILVLPLSVSAERLLVAAAAGYKRPLMEIYSAFTRATGIHVDAAFGNMRQVLAQVRDSDRVDLVVGDRSFLSESGLFDRIVELGRGRLVVAYGPSRLAGYSALARPEVERIALPDARPS